MTMFLHGQYWYILKESIVSIIGCRGIVIYKKSLRYTGIQITWHSTEIYKMKPKKYKYSYEVEILIIKKGYMQLLCPCPQSNLFFGVKLWKYIFSIHTWFWSAWNVLSIIYIVIDWYCTDTKQHIWDTFIPDDETSNIIEDKKIFVVFIDWKYIT